MRSRDDVHHRSHMPHRLQTTFAPPRDAVAVALRKAPLLPLDDLFAVVREFLNPQVSRGPKAVVDQLAPADADLLPAGSIGTPVSGCHMNLSDSFKANCMSAVRRGHPIIRASEGRRTVSHGEPRQARACGAWLSTCCGTSFANRRGGVGS